MRAATATDVRVRPERTSDFAAVRALNASVVLGHPEYYPRFGFRPSTEHGITSEYAVPQEAFMVLELTPGALRDVSGIVRYHEAFANV